VLVAFGVPDAVGFGLCMAAGSLIGFAWPRAVRFSPGPPDETAESATAFLGPAAGGQLIGQAVLVGGPVLLAWGGGSPREVTALFSLLAVFRAPYTLSIGLLAQLTGVLTTIVTERDDGALRRVRAAILAGTLVVVGVAAALATVTGSIVLPRIFGSAVHVDAGPSTLVAVGSALALANLVLTVLLMAHGRTGPIAGSWMVSVLGGAAAFVLLPGGALQRTAAAFAVAEAVAWTGMMLAEIRATAPVVADVDRDPRAP
jgi:hypothetical protein